MNAALNKMASLFAVGFLSSVSLNLFAADNCSQVLYQAKEIVTQEPGWPSAKYVLVQGDKIKATATKLKQLSEYKVDKRCIDTRFKDKVIVPGFIESHGHMLLGGLTTNLPTVSAAPLEFSDGSKFPGVKTPEQAIELIKLYINKFNDPNKTIIVAGWDVLLMGGIRLDRHLLNEISPKQPLLIWDSSQHFLFANDTAMSLAKMNDKDRKIPGVLSEGGQFNGQFIGPAAAIRILGQQAAKMLSPQHALPRMQSIIDLSSQHGITTTSEMAMGAFNFKAEQYLYAQLTKNQPKARVILTPLATSLLEDVGKENAINWIHTKQEQDSPFLMFRGVKYLFDDSFLGLSMMQDNYLDGHQGLYVTQPGQELFDALIPWWNNNVPIHIHTNGTAANRELTKVLSQLQEATPRFNPHFVVEHVGFINTQEIERDQKLGAMMSVNPYYLYYRSDVNSAHLGANISANASRLNTMASTGMTVSMHSDTPIGPPKPLEWMWIATNRQSLSGEVKAPHERVSAKTALNMITINAAKTLGIEDKVGSITAGKLADFTILNKNPLNIDTAKLRDIKVWGTVVGGRVIKAKPQASGSPLQAARLTPDLSKVIISETTAKQWSTWLAQAKQNQASTNH